MHLLIDSWATHAQLALDYGIAQSVVIVGGMSLQLVASAARERSESRWRGHSIVCAFALDATMICLQMPPNTPRSSSVIIATWRQTTWPQLNVCTSLNVQDMCMFAISVFRYVSQLPARRVISGIGGFHVTLAAQARLGRLSMASIARLAFAW